MSTLLDNAPNIHSLFSTITMMCPMAVVPAFTIHERFAFVNFSQISVIRSAD